MMRVTAGMAGVAFGLMVANLAQWHARETHNEPLARETHNEPLALAAPAPLLLSNGAEMSLSWDRGLQGPPEPPHIEKADCNTCTTHRHIDGNETTTCTLRACGPRERSWTLP